MKPLVNYCRWQRLSLRLRGRDNTSVWGQLVSKTTAGSNEIRDFHYRLKEAVLTIHDSDGEKIIELDEMGVPLVEQDR